MSATDGFSILTGGMDSGKHPRLIRPDQCALAVNVTFRGGFPVSRPSLVEHPIIFRTEEEQDWFERGVFQGSFAYNYPGQYQPHDGGSEVLAVCVSGRAWVIDLCTFLATEITPGGAAGRGPACTSMCWFVQATNWLVIQDGVNRPILWDGSQSRRSGDDEVPTGTIMVFTEGRIWMISGNRLMAGDLISASNPDAVIKFTERLYLTSGDLAPSFIVGTPTALVAVQQQDTQTGTGALIVQGTKASAAIFANLNRDQWADGIQRAVLTSIGNSGHRFTAQVNGDFWFRPVDGIRSYRQARAEVGQQAQLPFSTEVAYLLEQDSLDLLQYGSNIFWDNRLLTTYCPYNTNGRVYHRGILALDFDILSERGQATKPAWDGVWSGNNVTQLLTSITQAWAFVIDEQGRNKLMEITKQDAGLYGYDFFGADMQARANTSIVITGSFIFEKAGGLAQSKPLTGGQLQLERMLGRVVGGVEFRSDGNDCWQPWVTFDFCAPEFECAPEESDCTLAYAEQFRRLYLPKPEVTRIRGVDRPPTGGGNSGLSLASGYEFQSRLFWTGASSASLLAMEVDQGQDKKIPGCSSPETCKGYVGCCEDELEQTPELPITDFDFIS